MARSVVTGARPGGHADQRTAGDLGLDRLLVHFVTELTEGGLRRVEPQAVSEATVAADILDLSGTQRAKTLNHEHTSSYLFGTSGERVEPGDLGVA
jgi:hypothetical protein